MNTLKQARQSASLTLIDLARKMGVHPQSIINWEAGRCVPTPARIAKLQALFPGVQFRAAVPPGRKPREGSTPRARILPAYAGRLPTPLRDILTPAAVAPWCAPRTPAEPPAQTPAP